MDETLNVQSSKIDLDALAPEQRDAFLAELGESVLPGIMQRVWHTLDYSAQDSLMVLFEGSVADPTDEKKGEAVLAFLAERVPDFDRFVNEEMEALRREYEGVYAEVSG